ncbi:lactaldehyde dehydrogenase [Methanobacterium congolense]|uniref:Lactaldehyde dehydrogenase n=1 Tax=Methanobacterium congolense TaxID=118062 RepID=A0A1D3L490_9EURY|nr:lactaldehyde dehydrogenase [Methanobacterium congolense]SCG86427.1 Lactaldehyde dehydrogenase [Methanobacterium congolense]
MKMFINGSLVDRDEKIDVKNPANNETIDTVPEATREDVKNALEAANRAKKVLGDMSARKISRILYDVYEVVLKSQEEFSRIITLETGKPIKDSRDEMKRSVLTLQLAAEEAKRIYGETVPMDAGIGGRTALGFTMKIPLGVVAAITPFNYPVNLAVHKIAPALAAKNSVVFKPSKEAPLAALKLGEVLGHHLPDGAVNAVTGPGSVVGDELVTNPIVNKVSFTGSVETGNAIANRAGMKKLTLELGGNDPIIVLEDADLEKAAVSTARGAYLNAGQVCIGVKRIIVQKGVAEEFIDLLIKETRKLKMGDPMDPETDIGPLINEEAAINVARTVGNALENGAQILLGGKREGAFYTPTVLDMVDPGMDMVCHETFGPVAPIIRAETVDEAFSIANNTPYGLQAGVFTSSIENALKAARTIEAGGVMINKQPTFRTDNMPFGGFKMSGMGKEGVKYAVEDMTRTKLVVFG